MSKSVMNLKHILGLYEEPSTYKHDYQMYSPQPVRKKIVVNRVSRSSKVRKSSASVPNKIRSYDTLEQLDYSNRLPFNALWESKNITDISLQKSSCEKTINKDREDITKAARHTNEDTVDSLMQKLIIDFTYETTAELAAKETWPNFKSKPVCPPNTTLEKTGKPLGIHQQLTPNFSSGFKKWDKLQETKFLSTKLDVTLKKKRLPVFHPWLTVSQAITERYADDFSF